MAASQSCCHAVRDTKSACGSFTFGRLHLSRTAEKVGSACGLPMTPAPFFLGQLFSANAASNGGTRTFWLLPHLSDQAAGSRWPSSSSEVLCIHFSPAVKCSAHQRRTCWCELVRGASFSGRMPWSRQNLSRRDIHAGNIGMSGFRLTAAAMAFTRTARFLP